MDTNFSFDIEWSTLNICDRPAKYKQREINVLAIFALNSTVSNLKYNIKPLLDTERCKCRYTFANSAFGPFLPYLPCSQHTLQPCGNKLVHLKLSGRQMCIAEQQKNYRYSTKLVQRSFLVSASASLDCMQVTRAVHANFFCSLYLAGAQMSKTNHR